MAVPSERAIVEPVSLVAISVLELNSANYIDANRFSCWHHHGIGYTIEVQTT